MQIKKIIKFIIASCEVKWWMGLLFLISPTFLIAAFLKKNKKSKEEVRLLIIKQNWRYFIATPVVALLVWIISGIEFSWPVVFVGGYYAVSRINEIFYAFVNDATSHLTSSEHSSSLKYYERIPLAMKSYLELIVLYGVVVFVLNTYLQSMSCGCESNICSLNMFQAIYYSGVTITTLGYGEITPNDMLSQFLSIYEVINGFSLIVVSFTIYVSKSIAENEHKTP